MCGQSGGRQTRQLSGSSRVVAELRYNDPPVCNCPWDAGSPHASEGFQETLSALLYDCLACFAHLDLLALLCLPCLSVMPIPCVHVSLVGFYYVCWSLPFPFQSQIIPDVITRVDRTGYLNIKACSNSLLILQVLLKLCKPRKQISGQ